MAAAGAGLQLRVANLREDEFASIIANLEEKTVEATGGRMWGKTWCDGPFPAPEVIGIDHAVVWTKLWRTS